MSQPVKPRVQQCKDCLHCRISGTEKQHTLRIWCRTGMWHTAWRQPSRPGHRFFYRRFRSLLKPCSRRIARIARICPYFVWMNSEPMPLKEFLRVDEMEFERKPD